MLAVRRSCGIVRVLPSSTKEARSLAASSSSASIPSSHHNDHGGGGARRQYASRSSGGGKIPPPTLTRPPSSSVPPPSSKAPSSSSPSPPPPSPPPPTRPLPPPKPKEGMGIGTLLSIGLVAGGVGAVGYYNILANEAEKAKIDALLVEYGLSSSSSSSFKPSPSSSSSSSSAVETESSTAKIKEEATKAIETTEKKAKEVTEKVGHVVEQAQAAVEKEIRRVKTEEEKASKVIAKAEAVKNDLQEAVHKVEEAESLAEQLIADLGESEAKVVASTGKSDSSSSTTAAAAAARKSASQKQTQAALEHFATYQDRAKDLRFDTLTRAAEEALAQGEALRRHLEQTLLKDLGSLPPDSLRHRVVQLAGELHERTKWEALRLHEAVKKAEVEVSTKYTDLIDKLKQESTEELGRQARAFEAEKELALERLGEEKTKEFKQIAEAEKAVFTENITAAYEEQKAKFQAETEAYAKRQIENSVYEHQTKYKEAIGGRLEELDKLKAMVRALDEVFKTDTDYEHLSHKVHKITAAIMAFDVKLLTSDPIAKELDALKKVTAGDKVIETVLSALPKEVGNGVPTVSELQIRFPKVQTAAREAAFVPEKSPTLAGHLFGTVLAGITIKPKGLVDGAGADEMLARAAYHIERGDLKASIKELEGLTGLAAKTVHDWLEDAKGRLLVQQAVKAMSARSALLNSSLI